MTIFEITLRNGHVLHCDFLEQFKDGFLVRSIEKIEFNHVQFNKIVKIEFKHDNS